MADDTENITRSRRRPRRPRSRSPRSRFPPQRPSRSRRSRRLRPRPTRSPRSRSPKRQPSRRPRPSLRTSQSRWPQRPTPSPPPRLRNRRRRSGGRRCDRAGRGARRGAGRGDACSRLRAKRKRKRPPRSERPKKTRPQRVPSAELKPITRLPKPEHERGRRQERQGTVVSAAPDKTIVVRVDVVKLHPRYKKVVKRSTRLHAHDEENQAKLGDVVRIVETRPLSRMKRWRLQEIVEAAK